MSDKKKYPSDDQIRKTVRLSDEQAKNWDYKLIQWTLSKGNVEYVKEAMEENLISPGSSSDEETLIDCILEFNKLMSKAKPDIPDDLDKDLIIKGVRLAFKKKNLEKGPGLT